MDIAIGFLVLGILFFIIGFYYEKRKNSAFFSEATSENSEQNDQSVSKSFADRMHESDLKRNIDKFKENPELKSDPRFVVNRDVVSKDSMAFMKQATLGDWELGSDEAYLTPEEEKILSADHANSAWGWLIPCAISFSDSGKMRINFATLFYFSSKLKPLILPDGTVSVQDMFSLEEKINITMFTGKPFLVMDDTTKMFVPVTKEMLESNIIDVSETDSNKKIDALYDENEKLKNIIEKKYKPIESKAKVIHRELTNQTEILLSEKESSQKMADEFHQAQADAERLANDLEKANRRIKKLSDEKNDYLKAKKNAAFVPVETKTTVVEESKNSAPVIKNTQDKEVAPVVAPIKKPTPIPTKVQKSTKSELPYKEEKSGTTVLEFDDSVFDDGGIEAEVDYIEQGVGGEVSKKHTETKVVAEKSTTSSQNNTSAIPSSQKPNNDSKKDFLKALEGFSETSFEAQQLDGYISQTGYVAMSITANGSKEMYFEEKKFSAFLNAWKNRGKCGDSINFNFGNYFVVESGHADEHPPVSRMKMTMIHFKKLSFGDSGNFAVFSQKAFDGRTVDENLCRYVDIAIMDETIGDAEVFFKRVVDGK